MHYHILMTELCNSECSYCYKKSMIEENELAKRFKFDFSSPASSSLNIEELKRFILQDENAVIIFYGGEPLLEIDKIKKIIDSLKNTNVKFRMQTNGKLLDKIEINYLKKIEKILVSIDGNKERTDFNKGQGTFDIVTDNIHKIRKKDYKGKIVARMTISYNLGYDASDLYEQVLFLLKTGFDSVHWQLDAGFYKQDFNEKNFKKFVLNYNKSVLRLIDYWLDEMRGGRVVKLYPFLGIAESLLKNEKTKLRCGAGYAGYAITTDGKIVACPIMNCIEDFYAGDLNSELKDLKKFDVSGRCLSCNYRDLCGGRCLYWNKAGLWPEKGDDLICTTIKFLIDEIRKRMPEIKRSIDESKIALSDFEYEKYFGPEIIP